MHPSLHRINSRYARGILGLFFPFSGWKWPRGSAGRYDDSYRRDDTTSPRDAYLKISYVSSYSHSLHQSECTFYVLQFYTLIYTSIVRRFRLPKITDLQTNHASLLCREATLLGLRSVVLHTLQQSPPPLFLEGREGFHARLTRQQQHSEAIRLLIRSSVKK